MTLNEEKASIENSSKGSVDTFLNEFMKSIDYLTHRLANPADLVDYSIREERIKNVLKEAYLAGYAQCEKVDTLSG